MRHVDRVIEDVAGGGGGRVAEDGLGEGGVGGGEGGGGWGVVGWGEGDSGCVVGGHHVRRRGHGHQALRLLLLDAGRGASPPAGPHPGVGAVALVLGPCSLQVLLQAAVQVVALVWGGGVRGRAGAGQ